jgi:hypothetical protein
MPSSPFTFLNILSCITGIDIKGMDIWRERFGVSGMESRISYEFSTQGRGFEK